MAATNPEKDHIPGVLGGDLPTDEKTSQESGHAGAARVNESEATDTSLKQDVSVEKEKRDVSSNSSEDGSPQERDVEKGQPETHASEEHEESDPNIVDWDGPEDPENPQNWYVMHDNNPAYHCTWCNADDVSGQRARNGPTSASYPFSPC